MERYTLISVIFETLASALSVRRRDVILRKLFIVPFMVIPLVVACTDELPSDDMCLVPSGTFMMGCNTDVDSECHDDEFPYHEVYLDSYYINCHEVTVQEYRSCVNAGRCSEPDQGRSCNWNVSGRDNYPINCVSWYQSRDYCAWMNRRLPTEAEWEKAARGTDGQIYPWGNETATCDYAVGYWDNGGCGVCHPVCSKPDGNSPYGLCDMAGNLDEWVADWYVANYYGSSPHDNPQGPADDHEPEWPFEASRVLRGGSWNPYAFDLRGEDGLRTSERGRFTPDYEGFYTGFRCASSAD